MAALAGGKGTGERSSEHIAAARKMLSALPDVESDSDGLSDDEESFSPLTDSGDDDPEHVCSSPRGRITAQEKAPNRSVWLLRVWSYVVFIACGITRLASRLTHTPNGRPAGPGHKDIGRGEGRGGGRKGGREEGRKSVQSITLNQPGSGPISPASRLREDLREGERKEAQRKGRKKEKGYEYRREI
jgi:hypothetical protein